MEISQKVKDCKMLDRFSVIGIDEELVFNSIVGHRKANQINGKYRWKLYRWMNSRHGPEI